MNVHQFLFKVFIITVVTLKLTLVFSPIVMAFRAMRSAPFILQDEILASLLIGFGIAMAISAWNAMEFDNFRYIDLKYYLKPKQKAAVNLSDHVSADGVMKHLSSTLSNDKNWKSVKNQKDGNLSFVVSSNYKAKDAVTIEKTADNGLLIISKPKGIMWLVDFGRNYQNVIKLIGIIKSLPNVR